MLGGVAYPFGGYGTCVPQHKENPTKYRPHRPQGSKSAGLQVILAVDIVSSYRPQVHRYRPHS
jgi:hypothetical protein